MTISKISSTGSIVRQSGSHSCTLLVSIAIRRPVSFNSRIRSIIGSFGSSASKKTSRNRCSFGRWPAVASKPLRRISRNSGSVMSPRSSLTSGFSPSPASSAARIALPKSSGPTPCASCSARNEFISGVVRTPPKSETIASMRPLPPALAPGSATGPGDLVVAEALAALDRPAEEGDRRRQAVGLGGDRADQRAGAAQRPAVLQVEPQLERRPPLHRVLAVFGREQRLLEDHRRPVGVAEDREQRLLAVAVAVRRRRPAHRQQPAVGEDDPDRAPHHLARVPAHPAAAYLPWPPSDHPP